MVEIFLLGTLRSILRTALLSIRHTDGIEGTSDDVIADTRQVLHTATTYEHDGMFLKVVPDTRDVGCIPNINIHHQPQYTVLRHGHYEITPTELSESIV